MVDIQTRWLGEAVRVADLLAGDLYFAGTGGEHLCIAVVADGADYALVLSGPPLHGGTATGLDMVYRDKLPPKVVQRLTGGVFVLEPIGRGWASGGGGVTGGAGSGALGLVDQQVTIYFSDAQDRVLFDLRTGREAAPKAGTLWFPSWRLGWRFGDEERELVRVGLADGA